jgi:hypothetical protein
MNLKLIAALLALGLVAGCGAESVGAAATGAAIKKQELQQGQKTMEQAKDKIQQAVDLQQQQARRSADQ